MPPTSQVRTDLIISAQTKGFDKALRETLGLNQKALDGLRAEAAAFAKVDEKIKGLRSRVSQLAKDQLGLGEAMAKVGDKSSAAFREMEDRLRALRQESRAAATEAGLLSAAFSREADAAQKLAHAVKQAQQQATGDQKQAKGAFTQGLLQTVMPQAAGMFLDRGPGMRRQAMGQLAGGALRRAAGGVGSFLSTPFEGISGLQGAMSAIPGLGPIAAGQLGASASFAGSALSYQRNRLAMSPYIGSGDEVAVARARSRLRKLGPRPFMPEDKDIMMSLPLEDYDNEAIEFQTRRNAQHVPSGERGAYTPTREQQAYDKKLAARREAVARARNDPAFAIGGMGMNLAGLNRQESLSFAGQLFQSGGGTYGKGLPGEAGQHRRMTAAALSAQTMFGVDAGTSGAFLQAGRRGGLVGAGGRGADAMVEAIQDAFEQGLDDAEIGPYLQQMAQGIRNWEQTGISVNRDSLKALGVEINAAGIAGTRAAQMAGGASQYTQGIGQRGIQGGMDLLLLQQLGGFKGEGAEDYERAVMRLEQGDFAPGGMNNLIKMLPQMGGGARGGGASFLRRKLSPIMGPMSLLETKALMQREGVDTGISPAEFKAGGIDLDRENDRSVRGFRKSDKVQSVEDLMAQASRRVADLAPNLAKQAAIQNQQLEVGSRILKTVQSLESTTTTVNEAFLNLAGPTITKVSLAMEDFARGLLAITGGSPMEALKWLAGTNLPLPGLGK